jgi:pimeloyl-ACP methyl ester carboxylesterase
MKKQLLLAASLSLFLFITCTNKDKEPPKSGFINAGNFKVYYETEGKGDALILLHAGLQDHAMWKDQVADLSKDHQVITMDMPYHGQTQGVDTTMLIADVVKTVLDSLHIEKTSIVGLSMGGTCAQDFLIAYPDRVNKAILISTGPNGEDKEHPVDSISMAWWPEFKRAMDSKDTAEAAAVFTRAWAEGIYRKGDSLKAPVSQYVYATTLKNIKLHQMAHWPSLQEHPPGIEKLSSLKMPVLIIHGDKDLPYMMETNVYLEKHITGAKRILIKDVAHMLNMEKPEEVNRLIRDFLKTP